MVLFDKGHVIINGNPADVIASHHFYQPGADVLWFRRGDQAWVSRDKQVVERAWQIYRPMMKRIRQQDGLADAEGKLARKQSAIARQQAAFARKQASLARKRVALAQERSALAQRNMAARMREAAGNAARAALTQTNAIDASRLDGRRQQLDTQHARLAREHAALEARLDREREPLRAQRAKLAKKREALRQSREKKRQQTSHSMRHLLDEVIAKGKAERV